MKVTRRKPPLIERIQTTYIGAIVGPDVARFRTNRAFG